jgi:hypothetical protein
VGGALQTFAANVRGAEGLAFGPGGAWGDHLYVADADLTSLGSSGAAANGTGRIARIDAGGAVTTLVQHALLAGACGLAFDRGGRFGGDLFVADVLGERVLRVTSAGAVSVFASGFRNLASSCALAFGPDDALYVADPGSAQSFSNTTGSGNPPAVYRIAAQSVPVHAPPAPDATVVLSVAPNPVAGRAAIRFVLGAPARVRLGVFDASGRRVASLAEGVLPAGPHERAWDGRDAHGAAVAPGLYFANLEADAVTAVRRIVRVR